MLDQLIGELGYRKAKETPSKGEKGVIAFRQG